MEKIPRRDFLKLAAGGAALGLTSGGKVADRLIPYVIPPEHVKPGQAAFFATVCRECPAGCGMHLWHFDGRVTKAEGNPEHPVNRGALCARGQSAVQGLYDPDRLRHVVHHGTAGRQLGRGHRGHQRPTCAGRPAASFCSPTSRPARWRS